MRVIVQHGGYGCDTGCCGHWVEIRDASSDDMDSMGGFTFDHLDEGEDPREFAERLIREKLGDKHVADLDWENSVILDGETC